MERKRNEEISHFEKVTYDNIVFKKFLTKLLEELKIIHKSFPDFKIRDLPVKENSYYIISSNFIHRLLRLNNLDGKKELFSLLKKLLNLSTIKLEITISLDHSSLSLEVGDIYYNLIENIFPFYFYHNSSVNEQTLRLVNEWRESFSKKKMKIEIILPLKGFFFPKEQFPDVNEITFIKEKNTLDISLRKIPEYRYTSLERKYSNHLKYQIRHLESSKAKYCITAKGQIQFYNFPHGRDTGDFNYLWEHIKHVAESISLEGTVLRFGKPLYRLPWWISAEVLMSFNFLVPDWMNQRYMNNNQKYMIIPDRYSISIPFSDSDEEKIPNQNLEMPTRIFGFSQSQLNPEWELFGEGLRIEKNIEKSEPVKFSTSFKISDP